MDGSSKMPSGELTDAVRRGDKVYLINKFQKDQTNVRFLVHKEELLITAASFGHTDIVKLLIDSKATSLKQSSRLKNRTALHEACAFGSADIVSLILEHFKATEQSEDGISSFLEFINAGDREGMTAAHIAAAHGEVDCLRILVKAGANLAIKDQHGMLPIHWCAQRNHPNIVRFLYNSGIDIEAVCNAGRTPAHYAAHYGSLQALRSLVERNCDLNLTDKRSNQPIHLAAIRNQLDCLRFIIAQGVGKEVAREDGRRATHLAAQNNAMKTLHWLLENGALPDATDKMGNTPSHYANEGGHAGCYNCLLHHEANPDIENNQGELPSQSARRTGHPVVMAKGFSNQIVCDFCNQKQNRFLWEQRHSSTPVMMKIEASEKSAYSSPLGSFHKDMKKRAHEYRQKTGQQTKSSLFMTESPSKDQTPRQRDLTGRYYGEHMDAL